MRQLAPGKTLIEAPTAGNSATCKSCAHCPWMAMNALQGVVDCLEQGSGEIHVPEPVRSQALGCIDRMLDFVPAHPGSLARRRRLGAEHRRGLEARHRAAGRLLKFRAGTADIRHGATCTRRGSAMSVDFTSVQQPQRTSPSTQAVLAMSHRLPVAWPTTPNCWPTWPAWR